MLIYTQKSGLQGPQEAPVVNYDSKQCPFLTQAALWATGRGQATVAQRTFNGFHIATLLGSVLEKPCG